MPLLCEQCESLNGMVYAAFALVHNTDPTVIISNMQTVTVFEMNSPETGRY
jgi:hypothetical protein